MLGIEKNEKDKTLYKFAKKKGLALVEWVMRIMLMKKQFLNYESIKCLIGKDDKNLQNFKYKHIHFT